MRVDPSQHVIFPTSIETPFAFLAKYVVRHLLTTRLTSKLGYHYRMRRFWIVGRHAAIHASRHQVAVLKLLIGTQTEFACSDLLLWRIYFDLLTLCHPCKFIIGYPINGSGGSGVSFRAPDFYSVNINVGTWIGGTVSVNIGRNGHVYVGPGVNLGKSATLVSGSATANWMTQPNQMQSFLTGNSFSGNLGFWGGLQGGWTPGSGFSYGGGFVSPQVGGAWTYSWDLGKLF